MSSIVTNPNLSAFYRWLKAQPLPPPREGCYTQEALAAEVMAGRAHLSQVLSGKRPGMHTWRRLAKVLPMEGLFLLKQCPSWNNYAEAALAERELREIAGKAIWAATFGQRKPVLEPLIQ